MTSRLSRLMCCSLVSGALTLAPPAWAATYRYVDWTTADPAAGTASGTISLPDGSAVTVQFAAVNQDGSPGNLFGAQVTASTNYWNPSAPFVSPQVENAPPDTDILQLSGGQNQTYRVTLSEAIKDPIMAIVSLGQSSIPTTYAFDSPFTIVSQAAGYWGGSDTALSQLPSNVLSGSEGHGTIQFIGSFSTFSWTVPTPESWHGFTFGIRTTERLEPSGSSSDAGSSSSGAPDAGASTPGPDKDGVDASVGPSRLTPVDSGSSDGGCQCSALGERTDLALPACLAMLALPLVASQRRRRRR
jgi:hypothetical protein